jgi:hypothetical protein
MIIMGNINKPQEFHKPGKNVVIAPCRFSKENIPEEIKKLGRNATVINNSKLYKSRDSSKDIYVTTVKLGNGRQEVLLSADLLS